MSGKKKQTPSLALTMRLLLKTLRLLLIVLITGLVSYSTYNYKLVSYGVSQLKGQLHILLNTRPVAEVLADKNFPDSLRQKLSLIADIRRFAIDSIGLHDSKNYTTLYDQKGKPVLWVITACEPFSMKAYEWTFPLLGAVSYKGFFDKERGLKEVEALKKEGFDTDYSPTGGWSTLGWFKDPILSNMLRRSEGQLAELIIHELTHATLYLPGSVDYNENFATFTGEQGALLFLKSRFGEHSVQLHKYIDLQHDEELFGKYMVRACSDLDHFYKNMNPDMSRSEKVKEKYVFINNIILNISKLNLKNPDRYRIAEPGEKLPNNCFFMSYRRYRKQQEEFKEELLKYDGDLRKWLLNLQSQNE